MGAVIKRVPRWGEDWDTPTLFLQLRYLVATILVPGASWCHSTAVAHWLASLGAYGLTVWGSVQTATWNVREMPLWHRVE